MLEQYSLLSENFDGTSVDQPSLPNYRPIRFDSPNAGAGSFGGDLTIINGARSANQVLFGDVNVISPKFGNSLESIDYLWENYSGSFGILKSYNQIKNYEHKYGEASESIFTKWKAGSLIFKNSDFNDWLTTYIQIKDFIHADSQ